MKITAVIISIECLIGAAIAVHITADISLENTSDVTQFKISWIELWKKF